VGGRCFGARDSCGVNGCRIESFRVTEEVGIFPSLFNFLKEQFDGFFTY
jgi:hypothetical protein